MHTHTYTRLHRDTRGGERERDTVLVEVILKHVMLAAKRAILNMNLETREYEFWHLL